MVQPMKPNIIYIVADDLGFADLGCYGGREAQFGAVSPHLDALAAGGLRLTEGYSNSPVCSPTRFAMITMRYQYRLRGAAEEPIGSAMRGDKVMGLPPSHPTIASVLKEAGYRTALMVDAIQDQRQVVIKSLETNYGHVEGIAAATILGDGRIALILDTDAIVSATSGRSSPSDMLLAG